MVLLVASARHAGSRLLSVERVVDINVFETANAGFAQAMYEEFLRDPGAVGTEWRQLFESGVVGVRPNGRDGVGPASPAVAPAPAARIPPPPSPRDGAAA